MRTADTQSAPTSGDTMGIDLPPNMADRASAAIVRKAEDMKRAEQAEKQRAEDAKRRREQAMRDAAAQRRTPGTSGR